MFNKKDKNADRVVRHIRVRRKVSGTSACPRLSVYRSLTHIYAQIIDDTTSQTLVAASTVEPEIAKLCEGKSGSEQSKIVGAAIAKKASKKKIKTVVFDRGGYLYSGRVKALADAARENGLEF